MTKKRCENCKYLVGIVCGLTDGHVGFDWWCDDFEKKDNLTTEKRFDYNQYDDEFQSIYDKKNDEYLTEWDLSKIEKILNELNDENKKLKKQNENLFVKLKYTCEQINYSDKLREMIK